MASKAADSTNIYACGAVAHMFDIGVTARVSRVHVGQLQPGYRDCNGGTAGS